MFARTLATLSFVFSLTLLAVAMPNGSPPVTKSTATTVTKTTATTVTVTAPPSKPTSGGTCSTGPIQCCETVGKASDPGVSAVLGLLGIVVDGVDVLLGLGCSPVSVIGVGGGNCNANAVCCQNNNVGGLISIGCVPVIL